MHLVGFAIETGRSGYPSFVSSFCTCPVGVRAAGNLVPFGDS